MWREDKDAKTLVWAGEKDNGYEVSLRAAQKEKARARYRHDIQEASDVAGITFKVKRELRELVHILEDDERVLSVVPVTHRDERGLLIATTDRVLFVFLGWVNKTFVSIDYHTISHMRWLGGFLLGRMRLYIYDSEHSNKYTQAWNPAGRELVRIVNSRVKGISKMSREAYEVSRLMSAVAPREYQVKANDLIADRLSELEMQYKNHEIEKEDYFRLKLSLLKSMD